jgi:putative ABC transport system permease protein
MLAESLLSLSLPNHYREQQLGDLREAFLSLLEQAGRSEARRWYWSQVLKSVVPNLDLSFRRHRLSHRDKHSRGRNLGGAFVQDLTYAVRSFKRRPGFYSVVMLVFALGIGANTIIFSVVDGVVLRRLPYPDPHRLVVPWQTDLALLESPNPSSHAYAYRYPLGYPVYEDWLEQNTVFESFGVYQSATFVVTGDDVAERIRGARATHGMFAALGIAPVLGRTFITEEDQAGGPRHVIVGHGLWQRRFGSDSSVIGRTMVLNEQPYTIVGVMPQGFQFPGESEVWTTFSRMGSLQRLERDANNFIPIARLRHNVTLDQAQRQMEILAEHLKEVYPIPGKDYGVNIVYLKDDVVREVRPALLLLLGTVGMFLVIACANIANLLLVRASERRSELAVRMSLGAGRGRILRQLLTEGLTLSIAGGALGAVVAILCIDPFVAILPSDTPRLGEIGVDVRILASCAVVTVLTGVAAGALPALATLRTRLTSVLQHTNRGSSGSRSRNRTQAWLLVSQIALTFVLLVGAGLLVKSFARLTSVERGFDAEGVVTLDIDMRASRYVSEQQQHIAFEELYQRLRAIPGVTTCATSSAGPFLRTMSRDITGENPTGQVYTSAYFDYVSSSYFQAMGIPILAGRTFLTDETSPAVSVVIVNDAMARAFWGKGRAIGKRIGTSETLVGDSPSYTVVGVVGDVRHRLDADPHHTVYFPVRSEIPQIVLKTAIDPTLVLDAVRASVQDVDPAIVITELRILEQTIDASVAGPRVRTVLFGTLAALAATLAVVGIFGVLAYAVAQRTSEIGIRMALGAVSGDVIRGVVNRGLMLFGAGVAIGLAVSLAAVRALDRFLFQVNPVDPATLLCAVALLAVVALVASFIPARRAARVDPVEALRRE